MLIDNSQQTLKGLRTTMGALVTPIIYLADIPGDFFSWSGENFMSRAKLREENNKLKTEAMVLRAQMLKYVALETENARLRKLLRSERNPLEKRLVAEIIQIDSDPFSRKFMINKGSINDVYIGQVVIDSYGIIGQVAEVGLLNSRVIMLTDAAHAIPVKVARNGNRMIAYGTGKNDSLLLPFVPDTTDIKTGDLLLTSGLGRRFKSGYPVATVTSVERISGQAFSRITASPIAKLDQTASVLIVWSEDDVEKE